MNNGFFPKLAANNIKKNSKTYIPYILTCIMTVAMFYIVKSLSLNPSLKEMIGASTLTYLLFLGSVIVAMFAFVFLFYTNSFLIKRRKKEFGVFNILGMEKEHITRTLAWETLYVTVISLAGGLLIGIALDKVMFLLLTQILDAEISLGFFCSKRAIASTLMLFIIIFLLIFLNTVHQIKTANPIELLKAENAGEKEPKTKWLIALLGLCSLCSGYYIALTIKNPLAAMTLFFIAVLLVMAGTYMLFTAGSIAVLKILRKNKKFYYKTNHFITVSGMIYRMKQNAVGLANICILSTAVLIIVSSTTSLMFGMKDSIKIRYPNDFAIYSSEESEHRAYESFDTIRGLQTEKNLNITNETEYEYLVVPVTRNDNIFEAGQNIPLGSMQRPTNLMVVSLSDYNKVMGTVKTLAKGEILIASDREQFSISTLKIFDREYTVKEKTDQYIGNGLLTAVATNNHYIVVPDRTELNTLYEMQKKILGDNASVVNHYYGFDSNASDEEQYEFFEAANKIYTEQEYKGDFESEAVSQNGLMGLYGGFFFIGIFLGVLFVMATVLIIYYKQISEGYDDKERFEIMQKVGMSLREVKCSIHSQILMVFFLPLLVAGVHVVVASPLIIKLLTLLNLFNLQLYLICTIVCFVVFAAMYLLIYLVTAKIYYKIVSR